jgi:NAD(P)-dependent dehydrogenase (short-subunit alcohol dehydrogenase family)
MDLMLQGKTVLITGASKGIGKATAFSFAAEGAGHIHIASRGLEGLEAVKKDIQAKYNVAVSCHPGDLSQRGACQKLADAVGEVDILVNNAGAIPRGSIDMVDEDTWRAAWDLKVFGFINLTRIYYGQMKARKSGVIVNDIGNAGMRPTAGYITGSAGNASLIAFTLALGGESLDYGVRVLAINPGPVATDRMVTGLSTQARMKYGPGNEHRWQEFVAHMSGGRAATPEEIADAIVFFASPRSGYTSGAALTIDGGAMHRPR